MVGSVTLHEVDPGQELVGAHHIEQVFAGHVHEARQAGARAHEDVREAGLLQFGQGRGLADHEVGDEAAAQCGDLLHHIVDQ